jgi:fimbrial chaperone protein
MLKTKAAIIIVLSWLVGLLFPMAASAMSVQPLIVDMKAGPRGASGRVSVTNTFNRPIPVEITVHPLAMAPTGEVSIGGPPTSDFLVFPPSAVIQPGRTQSFRLQWRGNANMEMSANYIVSIAQVPVELAQSQSGIQLVYNFQIMANVAPARGAPILAITSAQARTNAKGEPRATVTIANSGPAHAYLAGLTLKLRLQSREGRTLWEATYSGAQLNTLVGYGLIRNANNRTFNIPIDAPQSAMEGSLSAEIVSYDGLR